MFKHKFATLIAGALIAVTGAAYAGSPFPSAAEEGPEFSVNSSLPATSAGLRGADDVFPSIALEGGEFESGRPARAAPRQLERSYAAGGGVFPSSSIE